MFRRWFTESRVKCIVHFVRRLAGSRMTRVNTCIWWWVHNFRVGNTLCINYDSQCSHVSLEVIVAVESGVKLCIFLAAAQTFSQNNDKTYAVTRYRIYNLTSIQIVGLCKNRSLKNLLIQNLLVEAGRMRGKRTADLAVLHKQVLPGFW